MYLFYCLKVKVCCNTSLLTGILFNLAKGLWKRRFYLYLWSKYAILFWWERDNCNGQIPQNKIRLPFTHDEAEDLSKSKIYDITELFKIPAARQNSFKEGFFLTNPSKCFLEFPKNNSYSCLGNLSHHKFLYHRNIVRMSGVSPLTLNCIQNQLKSKTFTQTASFAVITSLFILVYRLVFYILFCEQLKAGCNQGELVYCCSLLRQVKYNCLPLIIMCLPVSENSYCV